VTPGPWGDVESGIWARGFSAIKNKIDISKKTRRKTLPVSRETLLMILKPSIWNTAALLGVKNTKKLPHLMSVSQKGDGAS